jgi:hypothetical protein
LVLARSPIGLYNYFAYLANRLPWERERAVRALDRITLRNIENIGQFAKQVADSQLLAAGQKNWIKPNFNIPEMWEIQEPAAATSYLAALEYKGRVLFCDLCRTYADNAACRRALQTRIALAMYRLDEKKYPPRLADLVPKYLTQLPMDPYSGQPFQYFPEGLNLALEHGSSKTKRVEPNTPLFWSVGPSNVLLELRASRRAFNEAAADGAALDEDQREPDYVYGFTSAEPGWWNWDPLFFPLPK